MAVDPCERRSLRLVSRRESRSAVGDAVDATPWELPPGGGFGPVVIVLLVHPVCDGDGDDYPMVVDPEAVWLLVVERHFVGFVEHTWAPCGGGVVVAEPQSVHFVGAVVVSGRCG